MGDAGAYSNSRIRVRPPDKGSFPLDHKGICNVMREKWINCMKSNSWESSKCRVESAAYLQCRIENNLMSPEETTKLGFNEEEWKKAEKIQSRRINQILTTLPLR
ncbi:hypothetical protein ACTXT7_009597 [Hymenolepis weldensis]